MLKFPQHSCGDSRLSCVDCSSSVCPKCMVECPVGNRCRKCAAKTESHVIKVTPWVAVRTFFAASLAAYAFGFISSFIGGGYISWIITYAFGLLVGNLVHKISGFKLGKVIMSIVVTGIALGTLANPLTFAPFGAETGITRHAHAKRRIEAAKDSKTARQAQKADPDFAPDEEITEEQLSQMRNTLNTLQIWHLITLAIFGLGIITPFTGAAPQLSFFPFRR